MSEIFQSAELTPTEILAGDSDEFVARLVIGADYTDGPSRLLFDLGAMLGTSCPSMDVNEASGYVEVYCSNPDITWAKRLWDFDHQHFVDKDHPASREACRMVVVDVSAGLRDGDNIEFHWGETTGGFGPGAKVTSVVPRNVQESPVFVRYFSDPEAGIPDKGGDFKGYTRPRPDVEVRLAFRVRPRECKRLRLLRRFDRATLIPFDRFWNVADIADASKLVVCEETPTKNAAGVFEYPDKDVQIVSRRLPMTETPPMDDVFEGMSLFWGDVHTHSAYSCDCVRRSRMDMTPADLMAFARDRAGLDFFAVADHHQPAMAPDQRLTRAQWEATIEDIRANHEPGRFVVFPAIEYRCVRGDTAVVLNWLPTYDEIQQEDWTDIRRLWRGLEDRDYLTIPHFHSRGALAEGEWYANDDSRIEPVLEVFSDHGSFEREDALESGRALCKRFRFDRCGVHFLKQGYRYGFVANSDDHKGHAGVNGVTAVFSETLDRDALFAAYRERRVYGTTNARIRLIFTGNGRLMGSVIPAERKRRLHVDVFAENELKRIDVFRNGNLNRSFAPKGLRFQADLDVDEDGPANWYVRVTQQDNHVAWSSPIWFE